MIVKMRHVDLVALSLERDRALEALRELGVVHIDIAGAASAELSAAVAEAADAEKAVRLILKARETADTSEVRAHRVAEILAIAKDRETLSAAADELKREIRYYEPYGDFDPVLAKQILDEGIDLTGIAELPEKLPTMRLSKMQEKLMRVENRILLDTARLAACDEAEIIKRYPIIKNRLIFEATKAKMGEAGALCYLSGWVPVNKETELNAAAKEFGWAVLMRDPLAEETPPTLINPPKFVAPVKSLFEGLGIAPAYDEADVSLPFMCYFSLFFAMLVGDGAYGLIFLIVSLLMCKKLQHNWYVLLVVFSSATILWGLLSNTWFGFNIPWCNDWPTVRWLAGRDAPAGHEYDNMMFLCFTIGASHLLLARLWNAICQINTLASLREFGWAGIVLFMYILTNSIVGIFSGIPTWAYWMFGISFLTVFSSVKGMDKGMLFLNTMSVLGDIISYVRLFAVGLASVKVAENFNMMAIDLGLPIWLKWMPLVLILLIGHGLNLAMAGLSVLVHAVRLNTLEFSNHKGISWAGYAFKPFKKIKE